MNLIRVQNLKKTFGGTLLFDHVSFAINDRDKIALIGNNGVGKSTIFRMVQGEIAPDSGDIFILGSARIGYLSQEVIADLDNTLLGEMLSVFPDLVRLEALLAELAKALETDYSPVLLKQYSHVEEEYRHKGGYEYHVAIETMLSRFGFAKPDFDRLVATFSGGEKTRIAFAKLLLIKPDLLLLDEPTNHMDITIIEWLEEYLKRYEGAVVVITHDKYFIDKVADRIFELDQGTLAKYTGAYADYELAKLDRYEQLLGRYTRQQKEIAHLQSFVDRFRYKATKAKQAQDRIKKIARMDKIQKPKQTKRSLQVDFQTGRPTDAVILEIDKLTIGYDKPLQSNLSFALRGYDKLGIIGRNGIGKTTLLKTLLGELAPLGGTYVFLKQYRFGYFDQNVADLPERGTLREIIHGLYPQMTLLEVRKHLARLMFVQEDSEKDVGVLSGGEKIRLRLLLLLLERPGLLVLDEPTNHLDIFTKDIVEDVFEAFTGPIIFVSHDRYFINKVATKLLVMDNEGSTFVDGNYDTYKELQASLAAEPKTRQKQIAKREDYKQNINRLQADIEAISAKVIDLRASLFTPEIYNNPETYASTEAEIRRLEADCELLFQEMEAQPGQSTET